MIRSIETSISVYEVAGRRVEGKCDEAVSVLSHPTDDQMVVLDFGTGRVAVLASDLRTAIANATGWRLGR